MLKALCLDQGVTQNILRCKKMYAISYDKREHHLHICQKRKVVMQPSAKS
jgi:hypothetical protein